MAGFQILNDPSSGNNAATYVEQARPDSGDFAVLAAGQAGNGVVSGCGVTGSGSSLTVASGQLLVAGATVSCAGGTVTPAIADSSHDRVDLVVASTSGTVSIIAGTPAAVPAWPTIPAGDIVLAAVTVPVAGGGTRTSAPAFRASATGTTSVTIPSAVQVGDVLLGVTSYAAAGTFPSGWTALSSSSWSGGNAATVAISYRIAQAGDAGTAVAIGSSLASTIVAYSNVDTAIFASTVAGSPGTGSNLSTWTTAPQTTTDDYSLVLGAFAYDDNGSNGTVTISSPATSEAAFASTYWGVALGQLSGTMAAQTITATASGGGFASLSLVLEGALSSSFSSSNIIDKRVFLIAPSGGNAPAVHSSAPSATTTGFYFDTTLSKLGISDGSYWHYYTETSNTVPVLATYTPAGGSPAGYAGGGAGSALGSITVTAGSGSNQTLTGTPVSGNAFDETWTKPLGSWSSVTVGVIINSGNPGIGLAFPSGSDGGLGTVFETFLVYNAGGTTYYDSFIYDPLGAPYERWGSTGSAPANATTFWLRVTQPGYCYFSTDNSTYTYVESGLSGRSGYAGLWISGDHGNSGTPFSVTITELTII